MKAVTLKAISERTGASVATVSRVLNGKKHINSKNAENIIKAAKAMGYIANENENINVNGCILVIMQDIENLNVHQTLKGIADSCLAHEYDYVLKTTNQDNNSCSMYDFVMNHNISGVIMFSKYHKSDSAADIMRVNNEIPVMQCGELNMDSHLPSVASDNYSPTKNAVQYLMTQGKRRIAFVAGSRSHEYIKERFNAYCTTIKENGIAVIPELTVFLEKNRYDICYNAVKRLLKNKPDAIFCTSDLFASAALRACKEENLMIPGDIAIIGYDNSILSLSTTPPLSTINIPVYNIGYTACECLFELIESPDRKKMNQRIVMESELIIRGTT